MNQEVVSIGVIRGSPEEGKHPDRELMFRLGQGDANAMNELVHRFGPGLHRLIGRLTAWSSDTDDILQEVFLTAWRKASTFRGTGSVEGWLRRLAVNRCRNHRRARTAFERLLRGVARRWNSTTGDNSACGEESSSRLRTALSRLGGQDRTVLVLYYLEEWTSEQVAEGLGVQVETLHVRLHRARRRLRKLLMEDGEFDE